MYKTLLSFAALTVSASAFAEITTVTDILDREVTFDAPAKRAVVGFYPEDYMAIGTEAAYDKVVGMSKYIWQARSANWKLYVKHRPSLDKIPEIGRVDTNTFSAEKVISLNPDVLMLADWQYKGLGSDIERIEDAGISVVVVDYNAQTLERHMKSTQLIGVITGQEERAEKIANEYKQNLEMITQRLESTNLEKPKVYTEYGAAGVNEVGYTFGKNMWGAIATMAGGDNISAPFVEWWGKLNPEQIIVANPDVIVMTGYESGSSDDAMVMGQGVDEELAKQRLAGFKQRIGWSSIAAVKNNRMYAAYHGACRTILDGAMLQFYAKAMYPEQFKDLDPKQAYLDFYAKYLPVTPSGSFITQL
ncbi:ABC transporter substrate-binding protein [Vibrio aestuarianus]|uniref:ABC transporter substrate-binding protein n=1 Tax=Vibrio aestuarianus TaxID=28171 RepID=UPI00237D2AF0|nr:ABC transporter substrate-binding protein [Vibrio aestuarianus]EKN4581172.1 ABC transporter substrate-binding protein [Vibrio parahaemolyticus]MDE1317810.1 ABC transporter substrate-binding protein [Vibrio aestuarianus]